jgi:hypothetical protein
MDLKSILLFCFSAIIGVVGSCCYVMLMEVIKKYIVRIIWGAIIFIVLLGIYFFMSVQQYDNVIKFVLLPFYSLGLLTVGVLILFGSLTEKRSTGKIIFIVLSIVIIFLPIIGNILFFSGISEKVIEDIVIIPLCIFFLSYSWRRRAI